MRFTWDPIKSAKNFTDRGIDHAFASLIFEGPTVEREDRRHDYGERRVVAIGIADGVPLTVVYTDRVHDGQSVRHIITAWRSNDREQAIYEKAFG